MPFFRKEKKKQPPRQPSHGSPIRAQRGGEADRKLLYRRSADFDTEQYKLPALSPSMQDFGKAADSEAGFPARRAAGNARGQVEVTREDSVSRMRAFFEEKSRNADSPQRLQVPSEAGASDSLAGSREVAAANTMGSGSAISLVSEPSSQSSLRGPLLDSIMDYLEPEHREKEFEGVSLSLPPLQMTTVKHRDVEASRNAPGGGFGFILRKAYLPVPEDPDMTRLVHLVEPRADYDGPLMTGDRIIEVNGMNVEEEAHEGVVEMIKASGQSVQLLVASMPELVELNARGAFDDTAGARIARDAPSRRSGRAKQWTGTLRKKGTDARKAFKVSGNEVCVCVAASPGPRLPSIHTATFEQLNLQPWQCVEECES